MDDVEAVRHTEQARDKKTAQMAVPRGTRFEVERDQVFPYGVVSVGPVSADREYVPNGWVFRATGMHAPDGAVKGHSKPLSASPVGDKPDIVQVHITAALPIRAQALPFANRLEVCFGMTFPAVLIVDRDALDPLIQELVTGRDPLHAASEAETDGGGRA